MLRENPTCGCGDETVCNETQLHCDPCCRCIPLRLCVTLSAYGCDCDGNSTLLELDENYEYVGAVGCGTESMDLLVFIFSEGGRCYWRVISESFYVDQIFEISPDQQTCDEPNLEFSVRFAECEAIVSIQKYALRRLEPRVDTDCQLKPWCGSCECVCSTLCVTRKIGGVVSSEELDWDPVSRCWGDICLLRDDYTGECLVGASGFEPVPVEQCGTGLQFELTNGYDHIKGHCKICKCLVCVGCCFPAAVSPTGIPYLKDLEWEITAPNCADLNGKTGTLTPLDPMFPVEGSCGYCATYVNPVPTLITGKFPGMPMPDPYECGYSPCSSAFCFELCCDSEFEGTELPGDCTSRLRLLVSCPWMPLKGLHPRSLSCSGADHLQNCASGPIFELRPVAAVCDPKTGISAVFSLAEFTFDCETEVPTGPCAGEPNCCMPLSCSFSGATISISVKP